MRWIWLMMWLVISGCVTNGSTSRHSDRLDKWLKEVFGSEALTNSLNFYVESNSWDYVPERAIAIKDTNVFFVKEEYTKGHGYRVQGYNLLTDSCQGLEEAINLLKTRLASYASNPDLVAKERVGYLDPPTYTLRQYGSHGELIEDWHNDFLDTYGKISSLGEHLILVVEKCSTQ